MAKSQILVEWICEDTNTMGNCSTIPRITDLLHIISDNSDNYEYTDLHYCPSVYYYILIVITNKIDI